MLVSGDETVAYCFTNQSMPVLTALMGFLLLSGAVAAINPGSATSTPAPTSVPAGFSVTLTGYNAVPAQTKPDPSTTANGGPSNPEVVAARSQDLAAELPFGTVIAISDPTTVNPDCGYDVVQPLIGYRVITDVMNVKIKDHVDVLFNTNDPVLLPPNNVVNASVALGACPGAIITVVGHLNLTNVNDLPKTQADLVALLNNSGLALANN
jgi:3D (Asp-Asp-Asp) domain-containing protein